jgi:hypothetical protein
VRCIPAEQGRVVPRHVDQDQTGNSEHRACPVHARSVGASCELGIVSERFGYCDDSEDRKTPAGETVRPEGPRPPG